MSIYIGGTNKVTDYSKYARTLWFHFRGLGMGFDYLDAPTKEGLVEALKNLEQQKKIYEFRYEPKTDSQPYYHVSFELWEDCDDTKADNGDLALNMEVSHLIDSFFAQTD